MKTRHCIHIQSIHLALTVILLLFGNGYAKATTVAAKCDGHTDDTVAFITAIQTADVQTCGVEQGVERCVGGDGFVEVPGSVAGCVVQTISLANVTNVTLRGSGYDSWIKCNTDVNGTPLTCIGGSSVSNVVLENFRVDGSSTRAIAFQDSTGIVVRNLWVTGATINGTTGSSGFYGVNCDDCRIENSTFWGNGSGSTGDLSQDIGFVNASGGSGATNGGNERPHIIGNRIISTAVRFNIACYDCNYAKIVNNTISGAVNNAANTIGGYGILVYDLNVVNTHHNVITGNTIRGTQGSGIYVAGSLGANANFYHEISSNILDDTALNQTDQSLPVGAIALTAVYVSSVTGNTIHGSGRNGIVLSTAGKLAVAGNSIANAATGGIALRGGVVGATVTGNAVSGGSKGIFQWSTGADVDGSTISANALTSISGVGIELLQGGQNQITDNNLFDCDSNINDQATSTYRHGNRFTSGAPQGIATLVNGSQTVTTAEVQIGDRILLTRQTQGGALGNLYVANVTDGSFQIKADNAGDTSTVYWQIVH
jgi:parallel beta helix pectate lyase-like protein